MARWEKELPETKVIRSSKKEQTANKNRQVHTASPPGSLHQKLPGSGVSPRAAAHCGPSHKRTPRKASTTNCSLLWTLLKESTTPYQSVIKMQLIPTVWIWALKWQASVVQVIVLHRQHCLELYGWWENSELLWDISYREKWDSVFSNHPGVWGGGSGGKPK